MSLNIKNQEAYDLASELAQLTGKSMTAVVIQALREQRQQVVSSQTQASRTQELMAIAQRCAAHIHRPAAAVDHGEMLYDENGLPR